MNIRIVAVILVGACLTMAGCDLVENENTKRVEVEKLVEADVTADDVLGLLAYFGVSPDSDPKAVDDVEGLVAAIGEVFGLPDDEPVQIQEGDTISDVFARASGS